MNTSRLSPRLLMAATLSLAVSACGAPEEETPAPVSADINSPALPTTFEIDENGQVVQPVESVCTLCYTRGFYDMQVNGVASGWVCGPSRPNNIYNVNIYKYEYYGWRLVGAGYANQPRDAAVAANCGGNPNHGFWIQFAPQGAGTYMMHATASGQYDMQATLSGT
ncbi:MAG TPA: hypothetical protein VFZ09_12060 [Archangium sp.]|uniref:hypothetical protein n=1 Tax=Archangium sp. TaxID=1872627 RepID=UPI002E32C5A5|nr:hypothetical protein [Archangium sp.]HEX5746970.1 hypothetical protein [Archangium sp.]